MLCRHVFDKVSTEFRGISRISLNFAAPRPLEISEALAIGHLGIPNNAMISLSDRQTIAYYCSIPNDQSKPY